MNTLTATPAQISHSVSQEPTAGLYKIRNSRYKKKEKKQTVDVEKSIWGFLETSLSSFFMGCFIYILDSSNSSSITF